VVVSTRDLLQAVLDDPRAFNGRRTRYVRPYRALIQQILMAAAATDGGSRH
jgi:hypothetical protein